MTLLKKWSRGELFSVAGEIISLDLKVLPAYGPGATFARKLQEYRTRRLLALSKADKPDAEADIPALSEAITALPDQDFTRQVFADWVRLPRGGLSVEDDDGNVKTIETGTALLESAPSAGLILGVLGRLAELQQLGEVPKGGSGSLSTSSPAQAASSAPAVTSTEPGTSTKS